MKPHSVRRWILLADLQIIEDLHLSVAHAVFTALRARICQQSGAAVA
jgi:hypothetical protein